jgi:hypothetical protein
MRFFFSGPRIFGIRPGVSFGASEFGSAAPKRKKPGEPMAGTFIYVISGDHGRQKIGVSDNPRQRIRELQTGSPFTLKFEFVGQTEGTGYDIEGEAHFLLHEHRQSGEWFVVPPEVAITAVMAAARRLGHSIKPVDPDRIEAFAPKIREEMPKWAAWTAWVICSAAGLAVLAKTGRFLTALIVMMLLALIARSLIRAAIAIQWWLWQHSPHA